MLLGRTCRCLHRGHEQKVSGRCVDIVPILVFIVADDIKRDLELQFALRVDSLILILVASRVSAPNRKAGIHVATANDSG